MDDSSQIPGFREMDDWPTPPNLPLSVAFFDAVRGGGSVLDIADANGTLLPFFFDRCLGRLCYGSHDENSDNAAFVKSGSKLASDVFAVCESAIASGFDNRMRKVVDQALHWSQR